MAQLQDWLVAGSKQAPSLNVRAVVSNGLVHGAGVHIQALLEVLPSVVLDAGCEDAGTAAHRLPCRSPEVVAAVLSGGLQHHPHERLMEGVVLLTL
jgi:hypothetical protein